jgi:hypothetical protein
MKEFLDHLAERVGMVSLLVGTLFVVIALISLRFPPKKINDFYGYRTPRPMNSQAAWVFSFESFFRHDSVVCATNIENKLGLPFYC